MNPEKKQNEINIVKLIVVICSILFSFIGAILVFFKDFGAWYESDYYYYWIGSLWAPVWAQLFLVLLALLFLLSMIYSIYLLLLTLGKVKPIPIGNITELLGIFFGVIIFIFTAISVGMLAIFAAGWEWWLETSFYSSLVGSILIIIFNTIYFVASKKETTASAK